MGDGGGAHAPRGPELFLKIDKNIFRKLIKCIILAYLKSIKPFVDISHFFESVEKILEILDEHLMDKMKFYLFLQLLKLPCATYNKKN